MNIENILTAHGIISVIATPVVIVALHKKDKKIKYLLDKWESTENKLSQLNVKLKIDSFDSPRETNLAHRRKISERRENYNPRSKRSSTRSSTSDSVYYDYHTTSCSSDNLSSSSSDSGSSSSCGGE